MLLETQLINLEQRVREIEKIFKARESVINKLIVENMRLQGQIEGLKSKRGNKERVAA